MPWITMLGNDLGFLPEIIVSDDPRPAAAQLEDRYGHGGGYRAIAKSDRTVLQVKDMLRSTLVFDRGTDDEYRMKEVGRIHLPGTGETCLLFYPGDWLAIVQRDGSYEITRVD